jgi:sodium/hydrogen exchanger 8
LAILVVMAVTLIVTNICHKAHLPVPEAIIIVVIGGIAGALAFFCTSLDGDFFLKFEDSMALDFMLVLIAPIIFAEGYGMKSRKFFENITRILMHAFAGTAISAIIVAFIVRYLPPLSGFPAMKMTECLCFGALISAVDPVTTLAIFKEMNMVEKGLGHLYYGVLGESIINDAVGIVLFDGFADFVREDLELDAAGIGLMFGKFCITFFGSMILGIAFGLITAVVLKMGRLGEKSGESDHFHFNIPEIGTMLIMAYMPFLVATAIPPLSGIVAILFAGVSARHYAHYNLTTVTRDAFIPFAELLANLSEIYVFILLGMGAFVLQTKWYNASLLLWTIVACLIGRAAHVYPLGCLVNCMSRSTKFTVKEMHVQWCAGLRGAVAFMCSLAFPGENRGFVIATTIIVTFLSMVLLGWPTPCILRALKIQGRAQQDPTLELGAPIHRISETKAGPERWASRAMGKSRVTWINDNLKRWVMTKDAFAEREAYAAEVTQRAACGDPAAVASDGVLRGVSGALLRDQSAQRSTLDSSQQSGADTFERASFDQPIAPGPSGRALGGPLTSDRTVGSASCRRQRSGIANM